MNNVYDKKSLLRYLLVLVLMVVLLKVTGGTGLVLIVPIVMFCALTGKHETLLFC